MSNSSSVSRTWNNRKPNTHLTFATQKADLARIRDNQRRSRARRKEYLQELEVKYRSCEATGVEASAEIQSAARRVLDENKRLRLMLRQRGVSDAEIDGGGDSLAVGGGRVDDSATDLERLLASRRMCRTGSCNSENHDGGVRGGGGLGSNVPMQYPRISPMAVSPHYDQASSQAMSIPNFQQQPNLDLSAHPQNAYSYPETSADGFTTAWQHEQNYHHNNYQDDQGLHHRQQYEEAPASLDHSQSPLDQASQNNQLTFSRPYAEPNSSSCRTAASIIEDLSGREHEEVSRALGCGGSNAECAVDNNVVFEVMDRFTGDVGFS